MGQTEQKPRHRPVDLAKREAILDAAREEFFRHGFAGASIESIAAHSGVSKVTVYNRFVSKETLFAAVVERECKVMGANFISPDAADSDLRSALIAFGQAAVEFLTQAHVIRFERRIGAEAELRPEVGELFLDAGPRRLQHELTALLAAADRRAAIRCLDPALAAGHFYGMICGFDMFMARFAATAPDPAVLRAKVPEAVDRFMHAYHR